MRYIGGKSLLIDTIIENIQKNVDEQINTIIDLFAGSGACTKSFKENGFHVYSNDFLYFSYVLNKGFYEINKKPDFKKLNIDNPIEYLNNLTLQSSGINEKDCFIYNNYSPHGNCSRMYFQENNALKIDIIRITIENWKTNNLITESEYFYLLSSLLAAVPYVSNITGVYAAYLKKWDIRTYNVLTLKEPELINTGKCTAFNYGFEEMLNGAKADVLYADPPYNERQYLPNYHILETIAKYDYPVITGITGMRQYNDKKSEFCQKNKVSYAFEKMISSANVKYVAISYNNEGLLSTDELKRICKKYSCDDSFKLIEIGYRRYKSKIPNNKSGLKEQLYFFKKKEFIKSPLNYIGGKYKLLPLIKPLFPNDINTFVDLFCGGGDIFANIFSKKVIANDIIGYLINLHEYIKNTNEEILIREIEDKIRKFSLSKINNEGYISLREEYNKNPNPLDLFVLICFSFNHQIRFNSKHEFNTPFGKDRSCWNDSIKNNLLKFKSSLKNIEFSNKNFKEFDYSILQSGDFVYADPPYLITTGSYNDGKRGFDGWKKEDDLILFKILDNLNDRGIKFALSNVIKHKGKENTELKKWANKYNIHHLNYNYNNCSYHGINTDKETDEVLVTNY